MATAEKTYQGWKNYPTWNVHLWLSNEEPLYRACHALANQACKEAEDQKDTERFPREARFILADTLKEFVEDQLPELPASHASDLLTWAVEQVDWLEVADAFLED